MLTLTFTPLQHLVKPVQNLHYRSPFRQGSSKSLPCHQIAYQRHSLASQILYAIHLRVYRSKQHKSLVGRSRCHHKVFSAFQRCCLHLRISSRQYNLATHRLDLNIMMGMFLFYSAQLRKANTMPFHCIKQAACAWRIFRVTLSKVVAITETKTSTLSRIRYEAIQYVAVRKMQMRNASLTCIVVSITCIDADCSRGLLLVACINFAETRAVLLPLQGASIVVNDDDNNK